MIVDGEKLKKILRIKGGSFDDYTFFSMGKFNKALSWCEVPIQPQARIEAAIRYFRKQAKLYTDQGNRPLEHHMRQLTDLGRYFLTGEKDQDTWTDKDFGLEKEQEEK